MKRVYPYLFACLLVLPALCGCEDENTTTESECGDSTTYMKDVWNSLFSNPSEIYWGISSGVRSYTYNYTCSNICTKKNPKVSFRFSLLNPNTTMTHPFSVSAGVYTCFGVQAQHAVMVPDQQQWDYSSEPIEIGMNQCFSTQPSATIYPYITVSFNTLGSSHDDSVYLTENMIMYRAIVIYNTPK